MNRTQSVLPSFLSLIFSSSKPLPLVVSSVVVSGLWGWLVLMSVSSLVKRLRGAEASAWIPAVPFPIFPSPSLSFPICKVDRALVLTSWGLLSVLNERTQVSYQADSSNSVISYYNFATGLNNFRSKQGKKWLFISPIKFPILSPFFPSFFCMTSLPSEIICCCFNTLPELLLLQDSASKTCLILRINRSTSYKYRFLLFRHLKLYYKQASPRSDVRYWMWSSAFSTTTTNATLSVLSAKNLISNFQTCFLRSEHPSNVFILFSCFSLSDNFLVSDFPSGPLCEAVSVQPWCPPSL